MRFYDYGSYRSLKLVPVLNELMRSPWYDCSYQFIHVLAISVYPRISHIMKALSDSS